MTSHPDHVGLQSERMKKTCIPSFPSSFYVSLLSHHTLQESFALCYKGFPWDKFIDQLFWWYFLPCIAPLQLWNGVCPQSPAYADFRVASHTIIMN